MTREPSQLDGDVVQQLWAAWLEVMRGKLPRRYLIHLVLLKKRAATERRAATDLSKGLKSSVLRVYMPALPRGKGAERKIRALIERLAKLKPRGRGRPRKGEPKALFYAELRRALPDLGIDPVSEVQLIRDYHAVAPRKRRRR